MVLVGAGLPSLPGQMGRAKSYAERLFAFPFIGPLDATAVRDAIDVPAAALGVRFDGPDASREALPARDGGAGAGPAPLRRHRGHVRSQGHRDGPIRAQLIEKGMVWSPNHGDTAFTVPMFDAYLRRILPGEAWREG